jgi:hypothetical protein
MAYKTAAIRAYRAAGAVAILFAVFFHLSQGLETLHWSTADYFSYFTIISNLFAAGVLLWGAVYAGRERSTGAELLRGAAVVYMLTTGIVYAAVLSGQGSVVPWFNAIVHQGMPVVVALDWAIDPPHTRLAVRRTMLWLTFPLVYIAYTLIRGAIVNWYPYFFVNPNHSTGYAGVVVGCEVIGLGIIALILLTTWVGNSRSAAAAAMPGLEVSAR